MSIHRLIQSTVIHGHSDEEKKEYLATLIGLLSWGFPNTWSEDVGHQFKTWARCERCLPHVNHLLHFRGKNKIPLSNPQLYAELLLRCSW